MGLSSLTGCLHCDSNQVGGARHDGPQNHNHKQHSNHNLGGLSFHRSGNTKDKWPAGGFQAATGGLTPAPNSPILTMKHGFHMVAKYSDPSGTQIKALVMTPNEVNISVNASFFVNATGFAASLLPLMQGGSDISAAEASLTWSALMDSTLVRAAAVDQQETKCERAGVIQVIPADIKVALDLDEYITSLGQVEIEDKRDSEEEAASRRRGVEGTASARALASYIGMDLQAMLEYPGMSMVKMVINQVILKDAHTPTPPHTTCLSAAQQKAMLQLLVI